MLSTQAVLAIVIFVAAYGLIVSEKVHRTKVALAGASIVLLTGILAQDQALAAIDFNTIGLLIGMMILVAITQQVGLFEFMAIRAAKLAGGSLMKIFVFFFLLTAFASALLDNVTTVLFMTSITFGITQLLQVNPVPILIGEVFASNIGGTATLIGDPPNIMIGGAVGLSFMDFIYNLTPVIVVITLVTVALFVIVYRQDLQTKEGMREKILALDEYSYLKDKKSIVRCVVVLVLTIVGFILHGQLGLQAATVAMSGAALLLLISGQEPDEVLKQVEWNTIFFFVGLFILVGGLEHTGVIKVIAQWAIDVTQGNVVLTGMLVLWLSAIASAFIDNIPFVATMIPLVKAVGQIGHMDISSVWWALALGACLGGNGTIIGASANVVVSGLAEQHGHPISFIKYFKIGFPIMLVSIVISTIYMWFMYYK